MRTPNGPNVESNSHSFNETAGTQKVSENSVQVTRSQAEFLDILRMHGYQELAQSLKKVHDLALYFSHIPVDDVQKSALFDLKVIWEGLEKIEGKS